MTDMLTLNEYGAQGWRAPNVSAETYSKMPQGYGRWKKAQEAAGGCNQAELAARTETVEDEIEVTQSQSGDLRLMHAKER